jgi:phosphopantetheinyl transferase
VQKPTVQVWLVAASQHATEGVFDLLHDEEKDASTRFLRERDRSTFAVTRAALRCLLGNEIGVSPKDVRLIRNVWGKPMLPEQHSSTLDFSVSHAGDLSVIAISRLGPTGVDIERRRQVPEIAQIAADVFDQRTAANLNSLPASCKNDTFLRLWTAGEACLKATGLGFAGAGGRAPVKLVPNAWPQIEIDQLVNRTDRYPLSLHALDLPPDYLGSLVIQNRALDDLCHIHANPTPRLLSPFC